MKWSLETNEKGIFLKIKDEVLNSEEAINLSEALKRAAETLKSITGGKVFPCESIEQQRFAYGSHGITPHKIQKKREKKWNS